MVTDDELNWVELMKVMQFDRDQSSKIKIFERAERVKDFLGKSGYDISGPDTNSFYVLTNSQNTRAPFL